MILHQIHDMCKDNPIGRDFDGSDVFENIPGVSVDLRLSGNLLMSYRRFRGLTAFTYDRERRSSITEFSIASGRRLSKYLRECVPQYKTFITLTYPFGHGYQAGKAKRDLSTFIKRLRRKFEPSSTDQFSLCWFMEFQQRGSIHFHMFTTLEFIGKEWLSRSWYDICGTDDERHLAAGTNVQRIRSGRDGICSYARKYAAKQAQKKVPAEFGWVGRFWGVSGDRSTVSATTSCTVQLAQSPKYMGRVKKLQDYVDDCVFSGKIRMIESALTGFVLYVVHDQEVLKSISRQILILSFTEGTLEPKRWLLENPELADGDV